MARKFVLLFVFVVFLLQGWWTNTVSAEVLNTSLCAEVHGFAGEFNDNLEIPIQYGTNATEPIVLIVRPFAPNLGFLTSNWIELNVSYMSTTGKQVMRVSDGYGIMILSDVASSSKLNVGIQRLRPDGPVPFRFLSFQANRPTCFIEVSPQNAFVSPLPTILNPGANENPIPSTAFFMTNLSNANYGATIGASAGLEGSPHGFFVLSPDGKKWDPHSSGDLIEAPSSRVIKFSFTPDSRASTLSREIPHVPVSIWTAHRSAEGGAAPLPPIIPGAPARNPQGRGSKGSLFVRLFIFMAIVFFVYMVLGSCHRYHQGNTEFPEMIPHSSIFLGCFKCVQLAWGRLTGREIRSRNGDYNALDEQITYAY
ncbi:unnamed protein product [Phytomonas sp. EM1]|nr:unnamed protein product [Phytomonas sp. EM1]|eukprot:CCW61577.1 unnamed protein product [Phytomonas sp. isolate EM1]